MREPHRTDRNAHQGNMHRLMYVGVLASMLLIPAVGTAWSQERQPTRAPEPRCLALELHVIDAESEESAVADVLAALEGRDGLSLRVFNHARNEGLDRHRQICEHFALPADAFPLLYGCGQAIVTPEDADALRREIDALLTMTVFVRSGCQHCAAGKEFLAQIAPLYPGLIIRYRDLTRDETASRDMQALVDLYNKRAVSVPVFHFCNQLIVGFDRTDTTGRQLQRILEGWSFVCPEEPTASTQPDRESGDTRRQVSNRSTSAKKLGVTAPGSKVVDADANVADKTAAEQESSEAGLPPLPPLPGDDETLTFHEDVSISQPDEAADSGIVDLPFFGKVSAEAVGLPLFTIAVGLVDGFNPCAMWVLLFLLSILVNLKDRWKILAVAGTFVLVSGLVYFAFMAAWLSVFERIGLLRPAQIILGLLAMGIGAVHIKDFFAFHRGISLSIPESAKPTVYARVRSIVNAETLWGAIIGAATLAVLVNIIELLCTAGLPAMYTSILSMRELPVWQEYGYLGLYNVAYMFDDSIMVGIVVITLGRHKLQERGGRWLKLVSGVVIFTMGLVMITRPEWLI